MYYSALDGASKRYKHCIGAAYATNIAGPYHSQKRSGKDVPWFCPPDGDQSIDPDQFVDKDGKRYVVYKHNMHNEEKHPAQYSRFIKYATMDRAGKMKPISGGCGNQGPPYRPTPIKIQEVSAQDGVTKVGGWTIIMDNRGHADMGNSESPSMMRDPASGNYFLFFSTGCYMDGTYATHYAVSHKGPRGPFLRMPKALLGENTPPGYDLTGVGTLDVLNDGSFGVMFSHDPKAMGQRPMRTMRFHTKGIHVRPDIAR